MQATRLGDYLALTKPSITRMVVLTSAAGCYLGSRGEVSLGLLAGTLVGTALVASGTNALNQWWERDVDARMERTRNRPLPAGRLTPASALYFALAISAAGVAALALLVNGLTALLGALSLTTYVLGYTPLKKRTSAATLVGTVPGALPILGGWTAATGSLEPGAWLLFGILALWQMPHFLALGWLYREDYGRGGLVMLGVRDPTGHRTGRHATVYASLLLILSVALTPAGMTGWAYALAALTLGVAYLYLSGRLAFAPSPRAARTLFVASLAYLPMLLLVMVLDQAR
jgi:protoheme IX farnesyltransferase